MGFFSKTQTESAPEVQCVSYITFKCGGQVYGIPLEFFLEITAVPEISKLPDTSGVTAGVIEHKGSACVVTDMSMKLLGRPARVTERSCVLILSENGAKRGCLAEEPGEIIKVPASGIDKETTEGFRLCRFGGRNILLPEKNIYLS
ncbi:MAG: chemotaxis protein CheW [Cloacibacillus sp.]